MPSQIAEHCTGAAGEETSWREAFQASPASYATFTPERLDRFIQEFNVPRERIASWVPKPPVNGTFRFRITVSVPGSQLRIRLSNEVGKMPMEIFRASVGLAVEGFDAQTGSLQALSFGGQEGASISPGSPLLSDPLLMDLDAGTQLVVSVKTAVQLQPQGGIAIAVGPRDQIMADKLTDATIVSGRTLVTGALVLTSRPASVIAAFGDSITDGNNLPDVLRGWPDQLAHRLASREGGGTYAVVNAGIAGNRLLTGGWGDAGLARLDRDVLRIDGLSHVVVLLGINDIGTADRPSFGETRSVNAADIIAGYRQIIARSHIRGVKVIFGTLTPAGGSFAHSSPSKDATREAVNRWIRTSGEPDGLIDFERILADPQDPSRLRKEFDSGDHLHPSDEGQRAMGGGIDLQLFP